MLHYHKQIFKTSENHINLRSWTRIGANGAGVRFYAGLVKDTASPVVQILVVENCKLQFFPAYNAEELLKGTAAKGLALDSGTPVWDLNGKQMQKLQTEITQTLARKE